MTQEPDAHWWPDGASVDRVRECAGHGCESCGELVDRLDAVESSSPVTETGDTDLTSYANS